MALGRSVSKYEDDDYGYQKIIQVVCTNCKEWMDEKEVEIENIEEGMMGEDIVTFTCPYCKTEVQSKRLG